MASLSVAASAQFETRASFSTHSEPEAIAVGDFNHDGKLDLAIVTANTNTNNLAIRLGNGDGTFRTAGFYTLGVGPFFIAAADLNHDGNLDLVVANSLSSYLSILLGNGDGTFRAGPQNPPLPTPAIYVAVDDFNSDGQPDLVALDSSNPCKCISVLMGNGDGTFQNPVTTQPSFSVLTIGVGDFNGDGKLDLATAGTFGFSSSVNILLGNGDGTFRQGATYPADSGAHAIAVADFNGDGKVDMAIASSGGEGISVWLGNGDGTFQPRVEYATLAPEWVTAADVNGDGKPDLVAANFFQTMSGASVFLGNGDGTFQTGAFYPGGYETNFVAVGDFNGDLKPDLAITDFRNSTIITLLNTGVVSFSPTAPLVFPTQLINTISAPQTVTLTNTGTTVLSISSVSVSRHFQVRSRCGSSVAAGTSCGIDVTFKPIIKGTASGLVTLVDSASTKPQVIELSGVGTVVKLSPTSLNFPPQKVGTTSSPLPVSVTNEGIAAIVFRGINVGGRDFSENNDCGSQLAAGASCTINVTFSPKKIGSRSNNLNVGDNGGGSPQSTALSGTGTN